MMTLEDTARELEIGTLDASTALDLAALRDDKTGIVHEWAIDLLVAFRPQQSYEPARRAKDIALIRHALPGRSLFSAHIERIEYEMAPSAFAEFHGPAWFLSMQQDAGYTIHFTPEQEKIERRELYSGSVDIDRALADVIRRRLATAEQTKREVAAWKAELEEALF